MPNPQALPASKRHGRFRSTVVTRHADSAAATFSRSAAAAATGAPGGGVGGSAGGAGAQAPPVAAMSTKVRGPRRCSARVACPLLRPPRRAHAAHNPCPTPHCLRPLPHSQVPEPPARALPRALLAKLRGLVEALLEGPYNVLMGQLRWARAAAGSMSQPRVLLTHQHPRESPCTPMRAHALPCASCTRMCPRALPCAPMRTRTELEPGLGISRLEEPDFVKWMALAAWVTEYVCAREVGGAEGWEGLGARRGARLADAGAASAALGSGPRPLGGGVMLRPWVASAVSGPAGTQRGFMSPAPGHDAAPPAIRRPAPLPTPPRQPPPQADALRARGGGRPGPLGVSPFGCVSATMSWEALALVHKVWVDQVRRGAELPGRFLAGEFD